MDRLQLVQSSNPAAIPPDVDMFEQFGLFHGKQWRKFEGAQGHRPALPMHEHYSDISIMIPELIKFSKAL